MSEASTRFYGQQSLGARQRQEDQFVARGNPAHEPYLVVVADGMGGHSAGDVASDLAVETFIAAYDASPEPHPPARLRAALDAANRALVDATAKRPELEGMGTTLLAVARTAEGLFHISVGDSPLWQVSPDGLRRINADHSMRGTLREMVARGELTAAAAARHPLRNQIQAALGDPELELIDCPETPLALGDSPLLLLATDGIETLDEREILAAVRGAGEDARAIVAALLDAVTAKALPRQDNTTVYVWYPSGAAAAAPGPSPGVASKRRGTGKWMAATAVIAIAAIGTGYYGAGTFGGRGGDSATGNRTMGAPTPLPSPRSTPSPPVVAPSPSPTPTPAASPTPPPPRPTPSASGPGKPAVTTPAPANSPTPGATTPASPTTDRPAQTEDATGARTPETEEKKKDEPIPGPPDAPKP